MKVDVITVVEVVTAVVGVEAVDKVVVTDVIVSVGEVDSDVVVVVNVIDVDEDSADVVASVDDGAVVKDVIVVKVELSIGLYVTALAEVTFEITPAVAKMRISTAIIRTGVEFK